MNDIVSIRNTRFFTPGGGVTATGPGFGDSGCFNEDVFREGKI